MGKLMVGSALEDITPIRPSILAGSMWVRKSDGIIDPVYAGAVVIDNGNMRAVFVSCDLCFLPDEIHFSLRRDIACASGTKPEFVTISCTHTHNGPSICKCLPDIEVDRETTEIIFSKIIKAARDASAKLVLSKMGYGRSKVKATFNRRMVVEGGKVIMSPGPQDPPVKEPEGPADDDLQVIWFKDLDGRMVGTMINFSSHPTLTLGENKISADFPGVLRRVVNEHLGYFPVLYFQGACGNTSPIDFAIPENLSADRLEIMEKTGRLLGNEVLSIIESNINDMCSDIILNSLSSLVCAPARHSGKEDLSVEEARRFLEEHPLVEIDMSDINIMIDRYFAEWIVRLEGSGHFREFYPVEISAFRLGDIAIVTVPAELFTEYQIEIKKLSPFVNTMVWELTNGYCGYVLTEKALQNGSYEARLAISSKLSPRAGNLIVSSALNLLKQLKQKK